MIRADIIMYPIAKVQTASKASLEFFITFIMILILFEYLNALNTLNTQNVLNILKSLNNLKPLLNIVNAGNIDMRSMIAQGVKGYFINDITPFFPSL